MKLNVVKLSFLFIAVCAASCNLNTAPHGKIKKTVSKPSFTSLGKVALPLNGACNINEYNATAHDSLTGLKGLPSDVFYGKFIKSVPNYTALLLWNSKADYQLHYLATVSGSGKIIDKLELYGINCAEDANYHGEATYAIDKDLIITLKDTSASYQRNDEGIILKETIKTQSHTRKFHVDADGKITKDN